MIGRLRRRHRRSGRERRAAGPVVPDSGKPILFVDVDGVVSLFGFDASAELPGPFHWIDGIAHCISPASGVELGRLAERFDLVWATGWEEKANEYLPGILELPFRALPYLTFDGRAVFGSSHWKLDAIEAYAGDRAAAWIDDHIEDDCRAWAAAREAPTLLVETDPATGITHEHTRRLLDWAESVTRAG
jgi:HAD domain in Swiss Army Knife RNA repair proteins